MRCDAVSVGSSEWSEAFEGKKVPFNEISISLPLSDDVDACVG